MLPIWQRLARAREWRQLTVDQLSQLTGLAVESVIALERNDLAGLPPHVDPSTALRAYAAAVGLDADKVIRHYLSARNSSDESVASHGVGPPDIVLIEPTPGDMDEFPSELEPQPDSGRLLVRQPATAARQEEQAEELVPPAIPSGATSASPPDTDDVATTVQHRRKHIYVSAGVAAMLGVGLFSMLWKTPAHPTHSATPSVARGAQAPSILAPQSTGRDTQQIEQQSVDTGPTAAQHPPKDAPGEQLHHAARATAPRSDGEGLDGWWNMTNRVEAASYSRYRGLRLGYRLQLQQNGSRITGQGQKWTENGRRIPIASRTPITVVGLVDGRRVTLRFTERGFRRASAGTFDLELTNGSLSGTFESDAARSRGSSVAERVSPSEPSARPHGS